MSIDLSYYSNERIFLVSFVKMVSYISRLICIQSFHPANCSLTMSIFFVFFFFFDSAYFVSCNRLDDVTPNIQSESEECK